MEINYKLSCISKNKMHVYFEISQLKKNLIYRKSKNFMNDIGKTEINFNHPQSNLHGHKTLLATFVKLLGTVSEDFIWNR